VTKVKAAGRLAISPSNVVCPVPLKAKALFLAMPQSLASPAGTLSLALAFVDDAGKLQIRKDIYGRDASMLALLKNGGRSRDLENLVAHSQPSYSRPAGSSLPAGVNFASDNTSSSSGPSFFERLFGGPPTPPAPIGRRPQQQQRRVITR
jgi:hypothetical protein